MYKTINIITRLLVCVND